MDKKRIVYWAGVVTLGIALGVSLQFVKASWQSAPLTPPQDNAAAPINVGAGEQTKQGKLIVSDICTASGKCLSSLGVAGAAVATVESGAKSFSASGPFTVPTGVTQVTVEAWGAGAGGIGSYTGYRLFTSGAMYGPGGGSGAYAKAILAVTPGTTYPVTVGAGGSAGLKFGQLGMADCSGFKSAGDGGVSSFGSLFTVEGGKAGKCITYTSETIFGTGSYVFSYVSIGKGGVAPSTASSNILAAVDGNDSTSDVEAVGYFGSVTSTHWGVGGDAPLGGKGGSNNPTSGTTPGAGGGGGAYTTTVAALGGATMDSAFTDGGVGAAGRVVVSY